VHDSNMKEEVRVTVIATGFEKGEMISLPERREGRMDGVLRPDFRSGPRVETGRGELRSATRPVMPPSPSTPPPATASPAASDAGAVPIRSWPPTRPGDSKLPNDLEIPTFIRRQMD
jgi:cell division protein FtsZ